MLGPTGTCAINTVEGYLFMYLFLFYAFLRYFQVFDVFDSLLWHSEKSKRKAAGFQIRATSFYVIVTTFSSLRPRTLLACPTVTGYIFSEFSLNVFIYIYLPVICGN